MVEAETSGLLRLLAFVVALAFAVLLLALPVAVWRVRSRLRSPEPEPEPRDGPCPDCGGALIPRPYDGRVLPTCPDCGGIWFDPAAAGHQRLATFAASTTTLPKRCPSCGTATLRYGTSRNRSTFACERCGGWFRRSLRMAPPTRAFPT